MKNEWSKHIEDLKAYVGCERKHKLIYIGGPYYESRAQIHLTVKQAKEVRKLISEALKRCVKKRVKK